MFDPLGLMLIVSLPLVPVTVSTPAERVVERRRRASRFWNMSAPSIKKNK
jgi:hypothetical protein